MNLLIHDLNPEEFEKISDQYQGYTIISEKGRMSPCLGCFCCWHKTPGQCVIKDGYSDMGHLIHHSDEVVIISRYTYGGFSGFVKNVIDRCLGYVLPQFELSKGESHHQKRYDEDKPFTFIFHGNAITEEQKKSAVRYVTALCANFRSHVKEVIFREDDNPVPALSLSGGNGDGRTVLLNVSMRNKTGNSARFAGKLREYLQTDNEIVDLRDYIKDYAALVRNLENTSRIVLCLPLYVDGLPSQLIRLLEQFRQEYRGPKKKIYVLANMGLYESRQLVNLFEMIRQWTLDMGFEYCGGLGMSAGELIGVLMQFIPFSFVPMNRMNQGMKKLAQAVNTGNQAENIYVEPNHFPRWLYIQIANRNWNNLARKNGIDPKDLYRQL